MTERYVYLAALIVSAVTCAIRFLPFLVFRGNKKTPRIIEKLGATLPYAIMGMLVVYCLREIRFSEAESYLPALISGLVVSVLYVWKRNTLASILCGTVSYMVLVQIVF